MIGHTAALVRIAYIVRDPTSEPTDMVGRVLDVVSTALERLPDRAALIAGMARMIDFASYDAPLDCDTARSLALDVYPYLRDVEDALDEMIDALIATPLKVAAGDFVAAFDDERHMAWWREGALRQLPPRDRMLCGCGATIEEARRNLIRQTEDLTGVRITLLAAEVT